jgi:hypothetical protein
VLPGRRRFKAERGSGGAGRPAPSCLCSPDAVVLIPSGLRRCPLPGTAFQWRRKSRSRRG